MIVNLVTFTKKGARRDFPVGPRPVVIGRKPDADIRIPLSDVSRAHCQVAQRDGQVLIRDLGSSNGTFVNDQRITEKEATMGPGDRLRVGPVQFTVQIDGVPANIPPAPIPKSAQAAGVEAKTQATPVTNRPAEPDKEFDIDQLEELDADDLSDFDLGELDEADSGIIEEIEEISEDDLIPDDDSGKTS